MFGVSRVSKRFRVHDTSLLTLDTVFSLVFGCLALLASFVMREGQLESKSCPRPRRPSKAAGQRYNTFREETMRDV